MSWIKDIISPDTRKWEEFYIKRPRHEKRLPVVFSKEEIERMLDVTRNLKHKAILCLAYRPHEFLFPGQIHSKPLSE